MNELQECNHAIMVICDDTDRSSGSELSFIFK